LAYYFGFPDLLSADAVLAKYDIKSEWPSKDHYAKEYSLGFLISELSKPRKDAALMGFHALKALCNSVSFRQGCVA
jgi:hypothetical protein